MFFHVPWWEKANFKHWGPQTLWKGFPDPWGWGAGFPPMWDVSERIAAAIAIREADPVADPVAVIAAGATGMQLSCVGFFQVRFSV